MYHSITFGNKNTWEDWHLVPSSRPVFNPPEMKKKTIDIPGGNSVIDVSEALTGYPVFNNRQGSFEFIVMNDYWAWYEAYSTIMDYLHGKVKRAVLEDEPYFYYEGRFTVNNWKSEKTNSVITIDYDVYPYKRRFRNASKTLNITTTEQAFSFNFDFFGSEPVCPTIKVNTNDSRGVDIRYPTYMASYKTVKLQNGTHQLHDLIFNGNTTIYIKGYENCTVTIDCTYGRL